MLKKLRIKFIVIAMAAMTAVLAAVIGAVNIRSYVTLTETADRTLGMIADNGGTFPRTDVPGAPTENGKPTPSPDAKPDSQAPGGKPGMSPEAPFETRYFTVTVSDGDKTTADTENIAAVDGAAAVAYAARTAGTSGFLDNYRYLVREGDGETLYVFLDCTRDLSTFRSFRNVSLAVSAGGLAVVFLLIFIFSGMVTAPAAAAEKKQKQFITDAGHELKTPLTVIDADCELLSYEVGDNEWLENIRAEVRELTDMTNKLVFLARADEGVPPTRMTDLDFSGMTQSAADTFAPVAQAAGKAFTADIAEGISVVGDGGMLREVLSLLLDNAVKYANSRIRLSLAAEGRTVRLAVENDADDLPEGDLDRLFDRFYRPDASRSRETGGHGIGLSVVRAAAVCHGGRATAERTAGGIRFSVCLPKK